MEPSGTQLIRSGPNAARRHARLDATFGSDGTTVLPTAPGYDASSLTAATTDAQGDLLLAGEQENTGDHTVHPPERPAVVRLTPSGQFDRSFGEAGFALGPVKSDFSALVVDGAGRILAVGGLEEFVRPEELGEWAFVERFGESAPTDGDTPNTPSPPSPSASPGQSIAQTPSTMISQAALIRLLKSQTSARACHLTIAEMRKQHGCTLRLQGAESGTVVVTWYLTHVSASRAHKAVRVAIAQGHVGLSSSGRGNLRLRLTRAGLALLRTSRKSAAFSAVVSFAASSQQQPLRMTFNFVMQAR